MWNGYTKTEDIVAMKKGQKINHFPGSIQLGRKDLFWKNMQRMRDKFGKDFEVTPAMLYKP